MHLIDSKSSDPYFNIATEEFILRHKKEDYFALYINSSSIIIGKNQK